MSGRRKQLASTLSYRDIQRESNGTFRIGAVAGIPDITEPSFGDTTAWFLGPRAENLDVLASLIADSVGAIGDFRRSYLPGDPEVITPTVKATDAYRQGIERVKGAHAEFLGYLKRYATPYFSLRYQGHMLWDNTLPAVAGYFATMLHNPNNVTIQASTATTPLAILAGWDLCSMVGYRRIGDVEPWTNITADGSIANIESLWSCRETLFLPLSARMALRSPAPAYQVLRPAAGITVTTCDGRSVGLLDAAAWDLLNLGADEALALPARIARLCGIANVFDVWTLLVPFTVNALGWTTMLAEANGIGGVPVVTAPSTKHYSWPKAAGLLGFGAKQLVDIVVDEDARQDLAVLDRTLSACLDSRTPVAMVVAVAGSTEESAVDNVAGILELRERYRRRGLNFNIHVDAAWGGYQVTALRKDYRFEGDPTTAGRDPGATPGADADPFVADWSGIPISDYVCRQLTRMRECDGITVDPHKWGYVQYPAGSVIYRNGEARRLTTYTGAYIGGAGSVEPGEPTVGIFGIEGSKPGAAAAAVFMSHRVIRPSQSGHGRLIDLCMFNTALFYANLLRLNEEQPYFTVTPLPRLPPIPGMSGEAVVRYIVDRIAKMSIEQIRADAVAMKIVREVGPDQNILDYAFNFRDRLGRLNDDPIQANRFNGLVYDAFHVGFDPPQPIYKYKFLLTQTAFDRSEYGDRFMNDAAARLGLAGKPDSLTFLRSVIMDPYVTETESGSFFTEIMSIIRETLSDIVQREMWATLGEKV